MYTGIYGGAWCKTKILHKVVTSRALKRMPFESPILGIGISIFTREIRASLTDVMKCIMEAIRRPLRPDKVSRAPNKKAGGR